MYKFTASDRFWKHFNKLTEREGYVPNVVYTCGALAHDGTLIIPYAMSDSASSFATVPLDAVISAMACSS